MLFSSLSQISFGKLTKFCFIVQKQIIVLNTEEQKNTMWGRMMVKLRCLMHQRLNMKMGSLAGVITGSIVFCINYEFGLLHASLAFVKQFLFNFFMAAYNTKLIERLVYKIEKRWVAILIGGFLPALIATVTVFVVHWVGHTPEPFKSTYWQGLFNLPIFTLTAWMYCAGHAHKKGFLRKLFLTKSSVDISD